MIIYNIITTFFIIIILIILINNKFEEISKKIENNIHDINENFVNNKIVENNIVENKKVEKEGLTNKIDLIKYNIYEKKEIPIKKYDSNYLENNDKIEDDILEDNDIIGHDENIILFEEFDKIYEDENRKVCYDNHEHNKNKTSTKCTYGITNYADPIDMSSLDKKIFMNSYPSNMTLQDYINWLYCFIGREELLSYVHLKNLEKLKNKIKIKEKRGICPPPVMYAPPNNAKDYFEKLYNDKNEFNIAPPLNSIYSSMLGYNYNDYSEFIQNKDILGRCGELRNNDIYKKKTAKYIDNYIIPKDSNRLNEDKLYKKYFVKNIEI